MPHSTPRLPTLLFSLGLAAPAGAITLEDYVDPNSQYESAYLDGTLNFSNADQNARRAKADNSDNYRTGYDLSLNADYERVLSTMPKVLKLDGKITGNASRDGAPDKEGRFPGTSETTTGSLNMSYDRYLDRNPNLFWFGEAGLGYKSEAAENLSADLSVGVGTGRVINATPLAKTLRLVEEFQQFGLLSAYPGDEVMLRIAQIVNKEDEYKSRLGEDEYRTGWYQDIEEVFEGAGILQDQGLGALGVIKIDQVLNEESISTRKHGWVARAGATAIIQDHSGNKGEPAMSLRFEYAKPYGYRGQLINDTTFQLGDDKEIVNALSYSYEVSDVVDWLNTWTLTRLDPNKGKTATTNQLHSGFGYDLSNQLTFKVGVDITDSDNDDLDPAAKLTSTLRYRLR